MTDPLERDVLSFLAGRESAKPKDPLEQDVLSFLSLRRKPQEVSVNSGLPPTLTGLGASDYFMQAGLDATLADLEKQPEFAAQLAKDRARGLTDEQILAKIQVGRQVAPQRPDWAGNAPSTAEAQSDVLYGQPTGIETAVETGLRAGAGMVGTAGALMERIGNKLNLPGPEPERTPEQEAAMAKMRDIYAVGQPGSLVQQAVTGGIVQPSLEALDREVMAPIAEKGVEIQAKAERAQESVPRPKYARDFTEGLKTDPLKTLAISSAEQIPQFALMLGAAAISPELGLGVAWAQNAGDSYQEAKQRNATEEEAQAISGVVAATNMFLDFLPAGKALETLGGASRNGVKGLLYDMLEQAVAEGATETVQEANQMIVTAAMNAKDQGFTFEEFRDRVLEAGLSALVVGGVSGGAANIGGSMRAEQGNVAAPAQIEVPDATAVALEVEQPVSAPVFRATLPLLRPIEPRDPGIISPEELPFELRDLPLTRWSEPGQEDSFHPVRGGQFWQVGDSTDYHAMGSEGGTSPVQEVYTPKNPLVVWGNKDEVAEQIAPEPKEPLPTQAGDVSEVADLAAERGEAVRMSVGGNWYVARPDGQVTQHGGGLAGSLASSRETAAINGPGSVYDVNDLRGMHHFSDRVLTDYARQGGHDSVVIVGNDGIELIKLDPKDVGVRVPLSEKVQAALSGAPATAVKHDGLSALFEPAQQGSSDAALEQDVLAFLENRPEPPTEKASLTDSQKSDFADLAAASLAIGTSKNAAGSGPVEIVPGTSLGANRQLLAVDERGNEVGSLDYTVEDGGFRVHMIATGQRGSGAGRALMQAAAEDANGPMTGAASMTTEGEGFFRRIAETDPGLISESLFAKEAPDAGPTLAAPEQGGGAGVAAQDIRGDGLGKGVVPSREPAAGTVEAERVAIPPDLPAAARRPEQAGALNETATPEPRAQEPPSPPVVFPPRRVAEGQGARQEPSVPAREPAAAEAVPEPATEPDRGPGSLPARVLRPRQRAGQEGFAVVPTAIKEPLMNWWRKRMTQQGLAPRYYLDLKIRRDNQLAAKAARLDAYSIDLARAIRKYKGPLTPKQLRVYLDDAYRGMNLSGISGPMDETQVGRFERRGRPVGQSGQTVIADLSEQSLQRLREDSPGSRFPRVVKPPDQSSIGRKQLREMASRRGVSEDALVSIARKESGQSIAAAPEFLPLLREMRSIQDSLARELRRYGLLDDASIQQLEREFGLYVHRQYEAPRNPKYLKWVKKQPLWNRAYDLTKGLWDRQRAADRAEMIVNDLGLRRPAPPDMDQGVRDQPDNSSDPALSGYVGYRIKKLPPIDKAAQIIFSPGIRKVRLVDGGLDEIVRVSTSGITVRDVSSGSERTHLTDPQIGDVVFVPEGLGNPAPMFLRKESAPVRVARRARRSSAGTKAQAVADVKRTMLDPSTRDQFLDEYKLDAQKFDEAHERAKANLPDMPETEIWGMLHSYVEASGNRPVLPGGVPEGSKDLTALKRRTRKDDLERLLKGEVRSLDWNFLTTSLKMATIVAQHRFLVDLENAGKGDIFSSVMEVRDAGTKDEKALTKPIDPDFYVKSIETAKGREPGIDQRIIKRGSKKTAPLSGLFTTDEIMEVLNEQFDFKSYPEWLKYYMRGAVMAKGAATAGSAISLARNVWSQPLVLMANGVNPLNIKRFLKAGMDSYPYAVGNTDRTRLARIERYIELGFYNQGTDLGDIKRMEKRAEILSDDVPHGAGSAGARVIRETARGARNLYQAPDNQGKVQIFEALLPLYIKALPNLSRAEVEEHLAAKMLDATQNYPMSPPLVKDVSNFPFIAPFVTFRMEVIRNLYHAIRIAREELRSDNPELRKIGLRRAAGLSAALALPMATAFAARAWLNMDDEDDDATRRFMAPWNKNSTIAFLSNVDADGNVKFIDLSFMDYYAAAKAPFEALLRGDAEAATSAFTDPFGEDVFTKNVLDIWARGGQTKDGHDVYNKQDSTLTKSIAITKHLGAPLTPGAIKQVARTMDPERDKSSEILGLFGVRKTVINIPKELRRQVKMFQAAINDSRWIEKEVIRKEGTEEVYEAARRRSEVAMRRNIEEFIKDIQAARQLGLDEDAITGALTESGLGKTEAGLLLDGDVAGAVERYIDLNEAWGEEKRSLAEK